MERYSGVLPAVEDADVEAAVAGIDTAVLAAQQDRDRLTDAWRRTFSLPYWYFLAQTDEDGQYGLYLGTGPAHTSRASPPQGACGPSRFTTWACAPSSTRFLRR